MKEGSQQAYCLQQRYFLVRAEIIFGKEKVGKKSHETNFDMYMFYGWGTH